MRKVLGGERPLGSPRRQNARKTRNVVSRERGGRKSSTAEKRWGKSGGGKGMTGVKTVDQGAVQSEEAEQKKREGGTVQYLGRKLDEC